MNYSELYVSAGELTGTAVGNNAKLLGADVRFFLADSSFSGTAAQLKTEAYWTAAITAKTVIPFPLVQEVEPQDVEASYFESASGSSFETKKEKRKTMFKFIENVLTHSGLKTYANQSWYIWYYTEGGFLRCHNVGADSFKGLKSGRFFVNAQTTQTFSDPSQTPVIIEQNDLDDWDLEFGIIQPDFDMKDLEGVSQSRIVAGSSSTTTGTLTITGVAVTISETNTGLSGLLVGDFILSDASGVAISLTSAAETGSTGVYTLVATTAAVAGTANLDGVATVGGVNYSSKETAWAN